MTHTTLGPSTAERVHSAAPYGILVGCPFVNGLRTRP